MNCKNCNIPLYEKVDFCPSCGAAQRRPAGSNVGLNAVLALLGIGLLMGVMVALWPKRPNQATVSSLASSDVPASITPSPTPMPTPTPVPLVLVKSSWEKGGFGAIAMWRVTLKNLSDKPIGDINYRTVYYSETGNIVDKGGVDSILGGKMIQKVIAPKKSRTLEVNDGFTHSEAVRASFSLVDWKFVEDHR